MENINTNERKYTVQFATLGCKTNQFETEAMSEILESEGFEIVPEGSQSDIYIINTCAVTNESERKSRQFINRAKRENPNALVVAVGCSVQLNKEKINKDTTADIIIGTKNKKSIAKLIKEKLFEEFSDIEQNVEDFETMEFFEELKISSVHDKTRANIKIQDGCSQFCSYCIIPFVRGPIRSRDNQDIFSEVEKVVINGYKEIVLNGIHISSYGLDKHQKGALISLLEDVNKIEGLKRIRLGSLEPKIITEDFMKRYAKLEKACDHFHLSLQSGSNSVLSRMNRKYTKEEYINNVKLIKNYLPNAAITTDIIVGFPGESEEEFNETMELVKEVEFAKIHVFKYSKRAKTKAASMLNQIDDNTKKDRSNKLIKLGEEQTFEFMKKFIAKEVPVLIETELEENLYEGYSSNYLKILVKSDINIKNRIVNVLVEDVSKDYLQGKVTKE